MDLSHVCCLCKGDIHEIVRMKIGGWHVHCTTISTIAGVQRSGLGVNRRLLCEIFFGGIAVVLNRLQVIFGVGLLLVMATNWGCESVSLAQGDPRRPNPQVQGRPRSIVFDSPVLRQLNLVEPKSDLSPLPWYASRNDERLVTFAGRQTTITDTLVNRTYDRQHSSGGRSYDVYNNTTYRHTVSQTVR